MNNVQTYYQDFHFYNMSNIICIYDYQFYVCQQRKQVSQVHPQYAVYSRVNCVSIIVIQVFDGKKY